MKSTCVIDDCKSIVLGHNYCSKHYQRWKKWGDPLYVKKVMGINKGACYVDNCEESCGSGGMCYKHYSRMKNHGSLSKPDKSRGGWLDKKGYRYLKRDGKNIAMHRLVMEDHIGRPLLPEESVHHKNGQRDDNTLSNLELWSTSQPSGQRVDDKVAWAREILTLYSSIL
jgi:hypothetical protein